MRASQSRWVRSPCWILLLVVVGISSSSGASGDRRSVRRENCVIDCRVHCAIILENLHGCCSSCPDPTDTRRSEALNQLRATHHLEDASSRWQTQTGRVSLFGVSCRAWVWMDVGSSQKLDDLILQLEGLGLAQPKLRTTPADRVEPLEQLR